MLQLVAGPAPVVPMYLDTIIPSGMVALGITIVGNLWRRAKEEGRQAGREAAAAIEAERMQAELDKIREERREEMQSVDRSIQDFRESLATIRGVLVGVDGQNGMRADMKEARAEIRALREKAGALEMGLQAVTQRTPRRKPS